MLKNGNIAIFNLDATVCDDRHRRHLIPNGATEAIDYVAYHAACKDDTVLPIGAAILMNHIARGDFIVFMAARPFSTSLRTTKWIQDNFKIKPNEDFIMMMAPDNEATNVFDFKANSIKHLQQHVTLDNEMRGMKFVNAYDARTDVVRMYRAAGIETASVVNETGEFVMIDDPVKDAVDETIASVKTTVDQAIAMAERDPRRPPSVSAKEWLSRHWSTARDEAEPMAAPQVPQGEPERVTQDMRESFDFEIRTNVDAESLSHAALLGYTLRDKVTGFTGVATGLVQYLTGCSQFLLAPQVDPVTGQPRDSQWYDVQRCELVPGEEPVMIDNGDTPGCDKAAPKR